MTIRDIRGFDVTRDENRPVVGQPGIEVENALGQTTIDIDLTALAEETSVDMYGDYIPLYSSADAEHRKVITGDLPDATTAVEGTLVSFYEGQIGSDTLDTWVKPAGATMVLVVAIGGGGGGGGGGFNNANTSVHGGSGGGGGGYTYTVHAAADLPSTVAVQAGKGGSGGSGGQNGVAAVSGQAGGISKFGAYMHAYGGNGGIRGGPLVTSGANIAVGEGPLAGGAGGAGFWNGGTGGQADEDVNSSAGTSVELVGAGGGGGGSWEGVTMRLSAAGGSTSGNGPISTGETAGSAGAGNAAGSGTNGGDGTPIAANKLGTTHWGSGGGGGGSASGANAVGGRGGHGGWYGGAGGGGGACKAGSGSAAGGAGGDGAPGILLVITFL